MQKEDKDTRCIAARSSKMFLSPANDTRWQDHHTVSPMACVCAKCQFFDSNFICLGNKQLQYHLKSLLSIIQYSTMSAMSATSTRGSCFLRKCREIQPQLRLPSIALWIKSFSPRSRSHCTWNNPVAHWTTAVSHSADWLDADGQLSLLVSAWKQSFIQDFKAYTWRRRTTTMIP